MLRKCRLFKFWEALFNIDEEMNPDEIEVIGFIKDDEGKIIRDEVSITK